MEPEASKFLWQRPIPFQLMTPKEYDGLVQNLVWRTPAARSRPDSHHSIPCHLCCTQVILATSSGHVPVRTSKYVMESVCRCSLCIRLSECMKINSYFCKETPPCPVHTISHRVSLHQLPYIVMFFPACFCGGGRMPVQAQLQSSASFAFSGRRVIAKAK